jgi:hypothetical protein
LGGDHTPVATPVDLTGVGVFGNIDLPGTQVSPTIAIVQHRGGKLQQVNLIAYVNVILAGSLAFIYDNRLNQFIFSLQVNVY